MTPRVLQVVLSLDPGGTERLVVELAVRLHADIPMMVCCLDRAGTWARELQSRGIEVNALGRMPGFHPGLGSDVARLARRHEAGLIHAHHYSPFVYSCLAKVWRPSIAVVFTEHGRLSDAPASPKRRTVNRFLANFPQRVFAVSEDLKSHLVDEGFGSTAVSVIYNGIAPAPAFDAAARTSVRRELGIPDDHLLVGTIGRLDPVKGFDTLLQAIFQLPITTPITLVIIGDGPERQRLEKLARHHDEATRIRFLGQRDDARRWLAGVDVYVNSSISEGVSLTILEAMSAGLPVIATRVGGTPEVVDESCGRLIPPRDPVALAGALRQLGQDPALRERLGQTGRQRVAERFTLERMVNDYRLVYESAMSGLKRPI